VGDLGDLDLLGYDPPPYPYDALPVHRVERRPGGADQERVRDPHPLQRLSQHPLLDRLDVVGHVR
jgi:hypothetical protein